MGDNILGDLLDGKGKSDGKKSTNKKGSKAKRVGKGLMGGLVGIAGAYGLSELLSEDESKVVDGVIGAKNIASGVAGSIQTASAAAAGSTGATGVVESGSLLSSTAKTLGRVVGAPLTAGLTVYENYDELANAGKVDPMNQIKKTSSGLGDLFSLDDKILSMKRVDGLLNAISGATGTVYAGGTQIGASIREQLSPEMMDKIFSGFGLFGKTPTEILKDANENATKKEIGASPQGLSPKYDSKPDPVFLTDKSGKPLDTKALENTSPTDVKDATEKSLIGKILTPVSGALSSLFDRGLNEQPSSSPAIQDAVSSAKIQDNVILNHTQMAQNAATSSQSSRGVPQGSSQESQNIVPIQTQPNNVSPQQTQQSEIAPILPTSSQKSLSLSDVVYKSSEDDKKYFTGDVSKLDGMNPEFIKKLKAASQETGKKLKLNSGFRSQEEQDKLRADAVKKYGSEAAASKWVAKTSIHTTGNAIDLSGMTSDPQLVAALEKQGLHRPMGHEAWHWEDSTTKGKNRNGLASSLIKERESKIALAKAGGQPNNTISAAQLAQNTAASGAMILAGQGVPGAATAARIIADPQSVPNAITNVGKSVITASKDSKANLNALTNDKEFMTNLHNFSSKRGIDPNNVLAMMKYESGGYKTNVTNSLGYKGLFQIGKQVFQDGDIGKKLKESGFDYNTFEKESAARQLQAYQIYYDSWQKKTGSGNKIDSLGDMAALQLAPGTLKNTTGVMYKQGTRAYTANAPLDINKDGIINKEEYGQKMKDRYGDDSKVVNAAFEKMGLGVSSQKEIAVNPTPLNPTPLNSTSVATTSPEQTQPSQENKAVGGLLSPIGTVGNMISSSAMTDLLGQSGNGLSYAKGAPNTTNQALQQSNNIIPVTQTPANNSSFGFNQTIPNSLENSEIGGLMSPIATVGNMISSSAMTDLLGQSGNGINYAKGRVPTYTDQSNRGYVNTGNMTRNGRVSRAMLENQSSVSPNTIQGYNKGVELHGSPTSPITPSSTTINPLKALSFMGNVPQPLPINQYQSIPSELSGLSARVNQNYQLLTDPNIIATIGTLNQAGVKTLDSVGSIASNLGLNNVAGISSSLSSGLGAVDLLRQNGVISQAMNGNIGGVINSISPELNPNISGIEATYNKNREFAKSFNALTGNELKGTGIPLALGALNSGLGTGLGNNLSSVVSSMNPLESPIANILEKSSISDHQNNISMPPESSQVPMMIPGNNSPDKSINTGVETPLQVRNNDSALKSLVVSLLAYSFG